MNQDYQLSKRTLVATAFIICLIVAICGIMSLMVVSDPAVKYSQIMVKAAMALRDYYPDSLDWGKTISSARQAMMDELDPFSGYVRKEQLQQFEDDLSGGYFGIGVSVVPVDSGLLIYDVREGGPAASTGVLPGDIIIASDTIILKDLDPTEALVVIRGKENTIFSAKIFRPATLDTLSFEIIRKRIGFLHIPFAGFTADSVIYIRLLDFNAGASEDFKKALDSLVGKSGRTARGIIIDLRGNPGGLFFEARNIAELFFKQGEFIVGTSSRSKWDEEQCFADKDGDYSNLRAAVLIDNGSASAAEILAGTLKYSGHGVLVGDTTFGKGLVQGFIRLPEGDGLKLTISRYFFEWGRYINPPDSAATVHGVGIAPDILYSYIEDELFYLQLEWKLILLRFAHAHQDEIISSLNDDSLKLQWLERFEKYALENDFDYKSVITESAELLAEGSQSPASKRLAERLIKNARQRDQKLFEKYGDFLWLRLCQIAYERKFGSYEAYKVIVVPKYEPIKIAAAATRPKDSL
ncbi:MAG: S41 family peptidase [Candidatus Zixiibacteriota bacterium]